MRTQDIWSTFRDHFQSHDHLLVPSAPLPVDDPTLLFVSAGMVPFKPYFLGQAPPPAPRAVSLQKCVRTTDIDAVGCSMRYNTFFQMAGSFAFADYFKTEAITYAWDLLTTGLHVDPDRIWVTVFETDDESVALWRRIAGLPHDRIQRLGRADNLWNMGVPGPCGPSTEIFFDRGPQYGPGGGPAIDTDRFMEMWNLVFMTDLRGPGAGDDYEITGPLPAHNVDTGMGLERTAVVLQEVGTVYETDLLRPLLDRASVLSGQPYGRSAHNVSLRIVADHIRSAVMLVGDGVTPSGDGRGYVLRRLLRRAIRSMRLLGVDEPVLGELTTVARDMMAPIYPELIGEFPRIDRVIRAEEETFRSTLAAGARIFDLAGPVISGTQAFALHDTHGFPIELTLEMAADRGVTVDEEGFRALMRQQRERARSDAAGRKVGHGTIAYGSLPPTIFSGYEELSATGTVLGIVRDHELVRAAEPGEIVELILDRTPFYAESGGQASDAGFLRGSFGDLDVLSVGKEPGGRWLHQVRVPSESLVVGSSLVAHVDPEWRLGARQAHSATHVLHAALRQVLGPTALQSGSSNRPGHLRLDFSWPDPLSPLVRDEIELVANMAVRGDLPVRVAHMSLAAARSLGALALFGEAYGEIVRVVEIGDDWSRELCGGTHVTGAAQIGPIAILHESSVGSGVRRIEARVGIEAFTHLAAERSLVAALTAQLGVPSSSLSGRVEDLLERLRQSQREVSRLRTAQLGELASSLVAVDGVVAHSFAESMTPVELRRFALDLAGRNDSGVVVVFAPQDGQIGFVVATTPSARDRGLSAHELSPLVGAAIGGRGGGTDEVAQGSGTNPTGITAAIEVVRHKITRIG